MVYWAAVDADEALGSIDEIVLIDSDIKHKFVQEPKLLTTFNLSDAMADITLVSL